MFQFDLDALIDGVGPDYALDDIPAMDCPRCGVSPLAIRLSFADPPPADESSPKRGGGRAVPLAPAYSGASRCGYNHGVGPAPLAPG